MATKNANQGTVKDPEHDGRLKENREAGRTKGTTEGSRERQSSGGHSKAEEPHGQDNSKKGASASKSQDKGQEPEQGGDDMKSREYTDAEGNVHHHTKAYMEQHKGDK